MHTRGPGLRTACALAALAIAGSGCATAPPAAAPAATAPAATAPAATAPAATAPAATAPATVPPAVAARPAAPAALVISNKGVGELTAITYKDDDDQMLEAIRRALKGIGGLEVNFSVMDLPDRGEEGYFAVSRGETEVLQILRPGFASMRDKTKLEVHALDPLAATSTGVRPGDRAAVLGTRRRDVTCVSRADDRLGSLTCTGSAAPNITFVLDASDYKGRRGPVPLTAVAGRKILEIVWGCDDYCDR